MAVKVFERISIISTDRLMDRIGVTIDPEGILIVRIDFHGMKCVEAYRITKNIIALIDVPFIFDIVHGYNHGTAIKDMLHNKIFSTRVVSKYCNSWNPGETFLQVA